MSVKYEVPGPAGGLRLNAGWSDQWTVDTVFDVPSDEEERRAYRRRLGVNLERIRSTLTTYTQESIAAELGVDTETYARWERGSREPKAYDLHRIADAYGVPPEWLVEPTDSLTEIDRRLAQLRRAAEAAARHDAAEGQVPASGDDRGAQRGKR